MRFQFIRGTNGGTPNISAPRLVGKITAGAHARARNGRPAHAGNLAEPREKDGRRRSVFHVKHRCATAGAAACRPPSATRLREAIDCLSRHLPAGRRRRAARYGRPARTRPCRSQRRHQPPRLVCDTGAFATGGQREHDRAAASAGTSHRGWSVTPAPSPSPFPSSRAASPTSGRRNCRRGLGFPCSRSGSAVRVRALSRAVSHRPRAESGLGTRARPAGQSCRRVSCPSRASDDAAPRPRGRARPAVRPRRRAFAGRDLRPPRTRIAIGPLLSASLRPTAEELGEASPAGEAGNSALLRLRPRPGTAPEATAPGVGVRAKGSAAYHLCDNCFRDPDLRACARREFRVPADRRCGGFCAAATRPRAPGRDAPELAGNSAPGRGPPEVAQAAHLAPGAGVLPGPGASAAPHRWWTLAAPSSDNPFASSPAPGHARDVQGPARLRLAAQRRSPAPGATPVLPPFSLAGPSPATPRLPPARSRAPPVGSAGTALACRAMPPYRRCFGAGVRPRHESRVKARLSLPAPNGPSCPSEAGFILPGSSRPLSAPSGRTRSRPVSAASTPTGSDGTPAAAPDEPRPRAAETETLAARRSIVAVQGFLTDGGERSQLPSAGRSTGPSRASRLCPLPMPGARAPDTAGGSGTLRQWSSGEVRVRRWPTAAGGR
jgi:hypothetical protein